MTEIVQVNKFKHVSVGPPKDPYSYYQFSGDLDVDVTVEPVKGGLMVGIYQNGMKLREGYKIPFIGEFVRGDQYRFNMFKLAARIANKLYLKELANLLATS